MFLKTVFHKIKTLFLIGLIGAALIGVLISIIKLFLNAVWQITVLLPNTWQTNYAISIPYCIGIIFALGFLIKFLKNRNIGIPLVDTIFKKTTAITNFVEDLRQGKIKVVLIKIGNSWWPGITSRQQLDHPEILRKIGRELYVACAVTSPVPITGFTGFHKSENIIEIEDRDLAMQILTYVISSSLLGEGRDKNLLKKIDEIAKKI